MKKISKLFAGAAVLCAVSSIAYAADTTQKLEAYAHPCMFGSNAQETVATSSDYIVGGKIMKKSGAVSIKEKNQVVVDSWSKDMMTLLREKQYGGSDGFNEKMPVLRSELAVILSEGFNLKDPAVKKVYNDVPSTYWAKNWIDGALNAGVMIGYPDNNFRPDQPVTKAEVFATIAQLIDVYFKNAKVVYQGKDIKYIPTWSINATKEVVASSLLDYVQNPEKVINDEYLSKEQVANLVGALRQNWSTRNTIGHDAKCSFNYTGNAVQIKLADRLSARTSNVGDKFTAKTTKDVCINGTCFKKGASVKGEVVEVSRPGIDNPGYIKIKFNEIKDGNVTAEFPKSISTAQADVVKNPNVIARIVGFPFSATGRVAGVAGRSIAAAGNIVSNSTEALGDNISDTFVNTCSLQPVAGAKALGRSFVTVGKGLFNICELAVSGTFGVLYETADEFRYLIVPQYSNEASLNPGEELTILY